jgi:hypothetical protein
MNIVSVLVWLKEALKSAPAIVSMLLELKKLWEAFLATHERRQRMIELGQAIKETRETKNTQKLEDLIRRIANK